MSNVTDAEAQGCTGTPPSHTHTRTHTHTSASICRHPRKGTEAAYMFVKLHARDCVCIFFLAHKMRSYIFRHTNRRSCTLEERHACTSMLTHSLSFLWAPCTSGVACRLIRCGEHTHGGVEQTHYLRQIGLCVAHPCAVSFICTDLRRCVLLFVCACPYFSMRGRHQSHPP